MIDSIDQEAGVEISLLHPVSSTSAPMHRSEIMKECYSELPKIEIQSSFFYFFHRFELFLLAVVSCSSLIPPTGTSKILSVKIVNRIIASFFLSPSIFQMTSIPPIVIGTCLLSVIMIICYVIFIGCRYLHGHTQNAISLRFWVILHRLILPAPGTIIGHYIGVYLLHLTTNKSAAPMLLFTIFTGVLWVWSLFSCIIIYNNAPQQRAKDMSQIHYTYRAFEMYIAILPMVQSAVPGIISSFFHSSFDTSISIFVVVLTSLFSLIFVLANKPYNSESMNRFILFLSVSRIPFSCLWHIEMYYIKNINVFLLIIFGLILTFYVFFRILPFIFSSIYKRLPVNDQDDETAEVEEDTRPFPLNLFSFHLQDFFLVFFLAFSLCTMVIFNAMAAQRMPLVAALPDIFHDKFDIANSLRTSPSYGSFQFSNIAVFCVIGTLLLTFFIYPKMFNLRRPIFIYACLALIRAVSFVITTLPAPCAGTANCPCADPEAIKVLREGNALNIAFSWLFGLGMFLKYPQCGDLIISGHTMFLWIGTRSAVDVVNMAIWAPLSGLISGSLITLSVTAMVYIIIARNHYSIDVWFGFLFPELLWICYSALQVAASKPPKYDDSLIIKFMRWLEKRPFQLVQNRRLTTEL